MNRLLDDSIAWLYQDKNGFEIWKITDCVRPDDRHLTFDAKWTPQDATTYTVKGETNETGCFSGKVLKNGQEVGHADAQVYNRPGCIALIGRWVENGELIDFVARLSLHRNPRSK